MYFADKIQISSAMLEKLQFDGATNQKVIRLIGSIDGFTGHWLALETGENRYLKELRNIATIESIGSSTRIEGSTLTDAEVAQLIGNIQIDELQSREKQEVVGYYDTLATILDHYAEMPLIESNILHLHNSLLKHTAKDDQHRGQYKKLANKIVATYPGGAQKVIFKTTDPYLVPKEMQELLAWTNQSFETKELHPLITVSVFVYEFLSIHPFQDGNGRLARLLTTLLLLRNDYPFIQYISFENQVEKTKRDYYRALMDGQKNRGTEQEIIDQWTLYFLGSLEVLTRKLTEKHERYQSKGPYLNERQKNILAVIQKQEPLKVSDISRLLDQYSINTIKKDLQYMVQEGLIEKLGQGRGTIYISGD